MIFISCYVQDCYNEVKYICSCTSPEAYFCEKHFKKHREYNKNPHNFRKIFIKPVEDTKKAVLNFLKQEITKNDATKKEILAYFSQSLCSLNNALKEILNEIDSDSMKITNYIQAIFRAQEVSILDQDLVFKLLTFQPGEAIQNAKTIFAPNNNIGLFYDMGNQIEEILKGFTLKLTKRAKWGLEEQNISTALSKYKEDIRIKPNNDGAYNNIGNIFYGEKKYEEAIKYYDNAIRINPSYASYYTNKGDALYSLDKRKEALGCYNKAILIDSNDDDTYNKIGKIYKKDKNYQQAIYYFNSAISINKNCAIYYLDKGEALEKLGKWQEAFQMYIHSMNVGQHYDSAYNRIGLMFCNWENTIKYSRRTKNNFTEDRKYNTITCFRTPQEAYILELKDASKYNISDQALYNFQYEPQYLEAIKCFDNAININPNSADYYQNKGDALRAQYGWTNEEVMNCYKKAILIDPNISWLHYSIGNVFFHKNQFEEAVKYYNDAIIINPYNAIYYSWKGNALYLLGRMVEAMECYNEAIRIDPKDDEAKNGLGNIYFDENRYEEAIKHYNDAIKISPNIKKYQNNKENAVREFKEKRRLNGLF